MYKGITLLETLIALFILSVTLAFALPKWQKNDPKYFLEKEQQRLYFFLRNIQARAENSSAIWFILANQDRANQRWCITAQVIVFILRIVLKTFMRIFTILILKEKRC